MRGNRITSFASKARSSEGMLYSEDSQRKQFPMLEGTVFAPR